MNRNRLVLIGVIALGLALFVTVVAYKVLSSAVTNTATVPLATVVATAEDVPVGAKLEEKNLKLIRMPEAELPAGSFRSTTELVGRGVVLPLSSGELVMSSKLAGPESGAGLPPLIPQGMRAVSVRVNDIISVAGFVVAGTRVDVILTGNPPALGTGGDPITTTVLENVQVLAHGQQLQKNAAGQAEQVSVVTLLVSPDDAQKLTSASGEGRIQLALRNPLDNDKPDIQATRHSALYRGAPLVRPNLPSGPRRAFAKATPPPAAPAPYAVEMIRGEKRDLLKF